MKKLLISIGSILIMAFVVVLFINATESEKDKTKAKTEVTKGETPVLCSAACNHSTVVGTATCDPEKCKEMKSTREDGKCDPATCPMHMEGQPQEGRICGSSTACKGTCQTETAESK
jgi:hypothetical protein